MSESEKILNLTIEAHKHRMADYLPDSTRAMVLEAIEISSLLGGRKSIDDLDVKFEEHGFVIMDKSAYDDAKKMSLREKMKQNDEYLSLHKEEIELVYRENNKKLHGST